MENAISPLFSSSLDFLLKFYLFSPFLSLRETCHFSLLLRQIRQRRQASGKRAE